MLPAPAAAPDAQPAVHLHVAAVVRHRQGAAEEQDGGGARHGAVADEGAARAHLQRGQAREKNIGACAAAPATTPATASRLLPGSSREPARRAEPRRQLLRYLLQVDQVRSLVLLRLQRVADGAGVHRHLPRPVVPARPLACAAQRRRTQSAQCDGPCGDERRHGSPCSVQLAGKTTRAAWAMMKEAPAPPPHPAPLHHP